MIADAPGATPGPQIEVLPRIRKDYLTGERYVAHWFKEALLKPDCTPFDKARLNGASNNQAILEAVDSIEVVRKQGGLEGAKIAWFDVIAPTIPTIAEVVNKPKTLFHLDELEDMPPMRWLFDREIPENGLSVLYGPPGSGKSFVALDWAMRLALRQRTVVYVAGEGKTGYKNRSACWIKHHVAKATERPGPLYFYFEAVPLLNNGQTDQFVSEIQFLRPDLIIFDTLATMMVGGDENSSHDMGLVIDACRRMVGTLNTAVLLVHHTTKTGGDARGSSALRGNADVMMELNDFDDTMRLRNTKIKDEAPPKDKLFVLRQVALDNGKSSAVVLPSTGLNTNPNEIKGSQRKVLEWLASPVFEGGANTTDLRSATDLAGSTFFYAVKKLLQRKLIQKPTKANYVISEQGRSLAKLHGLDK